MSYATTPRRPRIFQWGVATLVVVVVAIAGAATWSLHLTSPDKANGLTLTTTPLLTITSPYPMKNLPPSHDNDAGRARALDSTPDNDTDAWQRG